MTLGHCTSPLGTPKIQKKSIVVSIPACHAGDRGSIPRRGESSFFSFSHRDNSWTKRTSIIEHVLHTTQYKYNVFSLKKKKEQKRKSLID